MTDIHSHDPQVKLGQNKFLSLQLHPDLDFAALLHTLPVALRVSAGIHPWHASEWSSENITLLTAALLHPRVVLIGEIGLDNVCKVPIEQQIMVFETQLKLAETAAKPVLIHHVGYQQELLVLKKKFKGIPTWILHGFRGKALTAEQYVQHGFFLSFGPKYQVEALRACPLNRLLIETDDSDTDLQLLYQKVAGDLRLTEELLESSISQNLQAVGLK